MSDSSSDRRTLVKSAAALAGAFVATPLLAQQQNTKTSKATEDSKSKPSPDRKAIMTAGLNDKEADCWELAAKTAAAFFALEEQHPTDRSEVATAIHVIQNKLLSRPTYRSYLAAHKAMRTKVEKQSGPKVTDADKE